MPAIYTTLEIPIELEYRAESAEGGTRDTWGAPEAPAGAPPPELVSASVLVPALEARAPNWRRTPPRRAGWYWLRRAGGETMIRRVLEIPLGLNTKASSPGPASTLAVRAAEALPAGASTGPRSAPTQTPDPLPVASRGDSLPPPASTLIVLEPGEGPRSPRHVPLAAYSQVWQWAGPLPVPGAALPMTVDLTKLDPADVARLHADIARQKPLG